MFAMTHRIVFFLAFLAAGSAFAAPARSPAAGSAPVVELVRGGTELPAARRRAVEQAILAAADASGVVVCRAGTALSQPESAALDRVCAEADLPRLWWDAEVGTERTGDVEVLDVLLKVAIGGPTAESPEAIVPPHVLLGNRLAGEAREDAVLDGIDRSLLAERELRSWLTHLKDRPELLRAAAIPPGAPGAGRSRPATAEEIRAWERELRVIADLLIDGRYLEGRGHASRLLKEDPTPEIAGRARELLAKAEVKLAHAGSQESRPPGASSTGQIEIRPARPAPAGASKRWERAFTVRVARDDRGFANGFGGRLVVSEDGIAFTRQGGSHPDWSVAWADLAAAHRAEGIWDVPDPLAFAEKGGRLHHLVRIDSAGKPLPGGPILSALAEGRLRSRKGYG